MKKIIVSIDGPAASGKGHIAKYISKKWGLKHLDSGLLYRRIASELLDQDINLENKNKIKTFLSNKNILSFRKSRFLRTQEISKIASKIAVYGFVRDYINKYQRQFTKKKLDLNGFVIDGRDIGSVVFRNANLKLYIDVDIINRAKRRYKQLIDTGEKSIYPEILKEIKLRDKKDKSRLNSPLIIPNGAHVIDNNGSFRNTTKQIKKLFSNL